MSDLSPCAGTTPALNFWVSVVFGQADASISIITSFCGYLPLAVVFMKSLKWRIYLELVAVTTHES